MNPQAKPPLKAILQAAHYILARTADLNEHRLWQDKQKRSSVERQFEIIAGALARLRVADKLSWSKVTDAQNAIRLGDAIRRDYDIIDYGILWRATRNELPRMLAEVEQLLAE